MPANFLDFEDAYLQGLAAFERWRMEYEAQFIGDAGDQMIAALLQTMTPQQREMLRAKAPATYDGLVKRLKVR